MRNLKKFLALVLATLMMVSAAAVVSADFTDVAADNRYAAAINDLAVKGIVQGTTETTFAPTADVTRTQMAIFLARTLSGETENNARWEKGIVPYTDVTEWSGAIEYVQVKGLINGWTDINGKLVFGPKDNVTYVQALKMAIGALGYTEELAWPWGYYNKAVELGLTYNMDVSDLNAELNRAEAAQIIYNVLYAEPANGGLTLAEANFGIQTANDSTLFVVTATPKQFYAKDADNVKYDANSSEVAGNYIGLQKLVNGIPSGNIIYVENEALGIADADVEDYFNRAIELINYNEETGEFYDVVLGEAPVVLNQAKAPGKDKKVTIDGVKYTPVDVLTGATLLNEMIIYNGAVAEESAKMLIVDEDGMVYNKAGDRVGRYVYTSSTGTKYYHDEANQKVISEAKALADWGVPVIDEAGSFARLATIYGDAINANMKDKAYQLALYDDDRDGLYERAVYTPVYMGVYYTYKANINNAEKICDGLLYELYKVIKNDRNYDLKAVAANVTYTDAAAKQNGAISVYTYNAQLNKVTVLDVLDVQTGEINRINATGVGGTGANTLKVTIDGTVYTVAYDFEAAQGSGKKIADSALGAKAIEYDKWDSDWTVEDLGEEAFLEIYDDKSADFENGIIDRFNVNDKVAFVAYNGYILMMDEATSLTSVNFAVVEDWSDFDLGEIYMDLWIAGEIEEDATVTTLNGKDLEDLSTTKFSLLLSKDELFWPGNVYTLGEEDGTYQLDELVEFDMLADDDEEADGRFGYNREYKLYNAKFADDNYLIINDGDDTTTYVDDNGTPSDATDDVTYDNNNADSYVGVLTFDKGSTAGERAQRLRTNDNTVFYFVTYDYPVDNDGNAIRTAKEIDEYDRYVEVFTGEVADDVEIVFDNKTQIWADSIGYGEDRASVVFVINSVSNTFFADKLTYVIGNFAGRHTVEADDASDFGLPAKYDGKTIYSYSGTYIDPLTGEKVASVVYSVEKLSATGHAAAYINEDNVVCNAAGDVTKPTSTLKANITDEMYYVASTRDYAKYGITDENGKTTTKNNSWGVPGTSGLNWYDWYYAANTRDWEPKPAGGTYAELPRDLYDVELTTNYVAIDFEDDYLKSLAIDVDKDGDIDDDDVVIDTDLEIVVYEWASTTAITGEEAYEILENCPNIWFLKDIDAATKDGVMEFYVTQKDA